MAIAGAGSFLKGLKGSITNITLRAFRSETVAQGKRAKGQSNQSPEYIQSQAAAGILTNIYRLIAAAVKVGFTSKASNQSQYNAFYSEAYKNALDLSSPPTATLVPADLLVSKGVMTPTAIDSITADSSAKTVIIGRSIEAVDATQNVQDLVSAVLYNETQDKWLSFVDFNQRASDPNDPLNTTTGFMTTGDTVRAYLFYRGYPTQTNAGTSSNSVNGTTTVVA